jgi:RNA polymerase sigma factor (sigma-70 family)
MVSNQIIAISESCGCAGFWWLWQKYRHYLRSCCLKWMGGNLTDAEDALSRAMLKAWEKVQKYAGKISNFKAWLTKLAHNLCVDIHRENNRGANRVEDMPKPNYYVAFGNSIDEGQVLNISQFSQISEIAFPPNLFGATIILQANNTWSDPTYS